MSSPDRKKSYVDPQVQGALVRRLVLHWISFVVVASGVAFCLHVLSDPFKSISQHFQEVWWTHGPFLLVMLLMLPAFVLDTIRLSHRFAGPIYRLRHTVRNIAKSGVVEKLQFRDFDFWRGLARDFNEMIDRFEEKEGQDTSESEKELETVGAE